MCIFRNKKASETLSRVQQNAVGHRSQRKQANQSFRFIADDLRFHLKKRHFLAQAEIVGVLSPTQPNSEKLGPAQCQFSLGLTAQSSFFWEDEVQICAAAPVFVASFVKTIFCSDKYDQTP